MASELLESTAPVTRRVRAFFAPVDRVLAQASVWDPASIASFDVSAPPAPWIDLGFCIGFVRKNTSKVEPLLTGAPAMASGQVRAEVDASVSLAFESWGKLQMALSAGCQQLNVLRVQSGTPANGSGGAGVAAVPVLAGSTASQLNVGAAAAAGFAVGAVLAVDVDYTGQTGFVGSGVSGGYVKQAALIRNDPDYVRRVTLNVGRVIGIGAGVLSLGSPLLAGVPVAGMKASTVAGFCDREGSTYFQEWSALFVLDGAQGDRIAYHYPRLQTAQGVAEVKEGLVGLQVKNALEHQRLAGHFRALPVKDANDGETVVCFRSYLPAAMREV